MQNSLSNKAKIGSILKQYITSEFEFNWYM